MFPSNLCPDQEWDCGGEDAEAGLRVHQTACAVMDARTAACAGLPDGSLVTLHGNSKL